MLSFVYRKTLFTFIFLRFSGVNNQYLLYIQFFLLLIYIISIIITPTILKEQALLPIFSE